MDAEAQLEVFIDRFSTQVAQDARRALAFLCRRLPTATRLVYDNYNALVIAFGTGEKASQAFLSLALYPGYLRLFFADGVRIPDPFGILEGQGSRVRSVRLQPVSRVESAEVLALIDAALAIAPLPPGAASGPLLIKSVSARQRPRRKGA